MFCPYPHISNTHHYVTQIKEIGALSRAEGAGVNVIHNNNRISEVQLIVDHTNNKCCISPSTLQKDLDEGDSSDKEEEHAICSKQHKRIAVPAVTNRFVNCVETTLPQ